MMLSGAHSTSGEIIKILMEQHWREDCHIDREKVNIEDLKDLALQTLECIVTLRACTKAPHILNKPHMELCLVCLEPTLTSQCEGFLVNVKAKLSFGKYEEGKKPKFWLQELASEFIFQEYPGDAENFTRLCGVSNTNTTSDDEVVFDHAQREWSTQQ